MTIRRSCSSRSASSRSARSWGAITGRRSSPSRRLIYPFALFAVFVPVVNLHFFLVFPRPNPILLRHKRRVLLATLRHHDGLSARALGKHVRGALVLAAPATIRRPRRRFASCESWPMGYIALAVVPVRLVHLCLIYSYRNAGTRG